MPWGWGPGGPKEPFLGVKGVLLGAPGRPLFGGPFGPLLTGHTNIVLNTPTYPIVGYLEGIRGPWGTPQIPLK